MGSTFHFDTLEQDNETNNLLKQKRTNRSSLYSQASSKVPSSSPSINLQLTVANKNSPTDKSNVTAIQRMAGNKAASTFVLQRNKGGSTNTTKKDIHDVLKGYGENAESADNVSTNVIGNLNNILTPGAVGGGIGTSTGTALAQGGGMTATSGLGTAISGATLISDSVSLHNRLRQWRKAKTGGLKDVEHITKRKAKIAGGNVASDAGNFSSGVVNTVAGGVAISSAINTANTALATTAGVTGVVGAAVTLPLQVALMVRQILRAEKQRKRMMRIKGVKNLQSQSPQDALKGKQEAFDLAEKSLAEHKKSLDDLKNDHKKSLEELNKLKSGLALTTVNQGNPSPTTNTTQNLSTQEAEIKKQETAYEDNQKKIQQMETDVSDEEKKVVIAKSELDAQKQITTALEDSIKDSGYLDDKGQAVTAMPSIQEIRDYALKKNTRGWSRRAIGATAAGVGVVAGGIGVAAAVETLKGNSGMAQDLGIGAAAVGGLAAAIGIGVGIWKLVSWAKKRKEQSKKMKAGGKQVGTGSTYNPLSGTVDQSNKRKYMATALYGYHLHGDSVQKKEAEAVIKALDPKLHDTIKGHDQNTNPFIKDQVISHLMDKMGSGG